MRRNPHRNAWRKAAGDKAFTCHALGRDGKVCGFEAKTGRQQADHADYYEVVVTRGPR